MDSLTLKRHNSFQNYNNRKSTHSFAPRPLIFKLQQDVLKFNGICLSWGSPNTEQETNFLNIKNKSLENADNLFISFLNLFISLIELKTFLYLMTHLLLFLTYLFL